MGWFSENSEHKANVCKNFAIGGKIIVDDKDLATNFKKFFVNVGPST